jgi:hypothetical protein
LKRIPIKLEDKHTRQDHQTRGLLVDAFLCVDVSTPDIAATSKLWQPLWIAGLRRRQRLGLPRLENSHWDWSTKANWLSLASYRSLGIECEGSMQGMMLVITDGHEARLPPDKGKSVVYVDYVQVAPWNDAALVDRPRFGAVGSFLMEGAVRLSIDMQYGGRVGLHSLKRSEGFYSNLRLTAVEIETIDRHALGLWYFEWTKQEADDFLQRSTP